MPFVAHDAKTGERIDITRYENPRLEIEADRIVCPECGHRVIIKAGEIKIAHFAHYRKDGCKYGVGESANHLLGKTIIADYLRSKPQYFYVKVEYEWVIGNRRADVVQLFPTGWIVAHEIQLSAITTAELNERTQDYLSEGCDVVWYLGESADTETNRRWLRENQGYEQAIFFRKEDENWIELNTIPANGKHNVVQPNGKHNVVQPGGSGKNG